MTGEPTPDVDGANALAQAMVGGELLTLLVSGTIQLTFYVGHGSYTVQAGTEFVLESPDAIHEIDPAAPTSVAPLLALLTTATIVRATVSYPNTLTIELDTEQRLTFRGDASYEAWELSGPRGLLIIAVPGGDIAIWGPDEGDDARDGKGTIIRG